MSQGFRVTEGTIGPKLVPTGAWSDDARQYMKEHDIRELELNSAAGWSDADGIGFLDRLPFLEVLSITDQTLRDLAPIHSLRALRELNVSTECTSPIDFACFPRLDTCALSWRPKARSLFGCTSLRRLFLTRYRAHDLRAFERLTALESLRIKGTSLHTCAGVEKLGRLRHLEIELATRLSSLEGIGSLVRLEKLAIDTCRKIGHIEELRALTGLEFLSLSNDGPIASLQPVAGMNRLRELLFNESTNVLDGDLSVLARLPELRKTAFQERPHYSHRRADLPLG